ncbi:uncharacterized protein FOMMEDRAFT_148591 [Fomitiporia mediterranea MF3/22]|uniref:uncharacterized protein n=1 Tax=Fomitiporia mediterranea (strain MF3/22) TaxID=694068 RepID=UPI0004409255|nr:uncharacterized protein FOMMEDRAFT_148591 [Fomitiporia mediterranea MF3/22]EJC99738.1 hypothetical protein FOMMEDRAFT_148591 [Fomitiporia mediterranea MF3/22]
MAKSKVLLVFCDGTGMDGNTSDGSPAGTEAAAQNVQYPTNVLRLSRAVKDRTADGRRQVVFYQSGVGSEADFKGDQVNGTILMQALGTAVASKIRDAYAFIAQNFDDGDEICIFGFSRGAYTARKLAGLVDRVGLLERENLGYFFAIWNQLDQGKTPTIPSGTRSTKIKCVGVWDTVESVFSGLLPLNPNANALGITDAAIPASIEVALHALSLHENRDKFLPTRWGSPAPGQVFKQMWFPGAHSDVGGGYQRHELADISLFWMAGEISSFINLDLDFIRQSAQESPDPWGASQPHNSYDETIAPEKAVIFPKNRLDGGKISQTDSFHQSVLQSPDSLKDPLFMITLNSLKQKFGSGWQPTSPPLNDFETLCKEKWSSPPAKDQGSIQFDLPQTLFGPLESAASLLPKLPLRF